MKNRFDISSLPWQNRPDHRSLKFMRAIWTESRPCLFPCQHIYGWSGRFLFATRNASLSLSLSLSKCIVSRIIVQLSRKPALDRTRSLLRLANDSIWIEWNFFFSTKLSFSLPFAFLIRKRRSFFFFFFCLLPTMKKFPAFISSYINIKEKIRREKNFRHYRRKRIVAMYAWRWGRVLTRKEENEREERVSTLENSLIRENGSRVKRAIILNSRSFNSVSFSCFDGMNLRCKIFFASIDLALNRIFKSTRVRRLRRAKGARTRGDKSRGQKLSLLSKNRFTPS